MYLTTTTTPPPTSTTTPTPPPPPSALTTTTTATTIVTKQTFIDELKLNEYTIYTFNIFEFCVFYNKNLFIFIL
ncbi:unnamed protein product [Schistosoma margrebowiei]|uniref:Uncharacterized protein n=1 Tax=Schistosoma margrebowiei TaxID=48269 RepID=A0A183M4N6_9TREM|nr:unnamed protein product [Schistosoma margrebowiei]